LTGVWPLYEVEDGKYRITYRPKERRPIKEWLESQGRFRHLLKEENKKIVEELQKAVDEREKRLLRNSRQTLRSAPYLFGFPPIRGRMFPP